MDWKRGEVASEANRLCVTSRGLRPLPPTPKTNSQHSEPYATANGMRAIHCVVNGLLLKFGLKRSASCVCSS